RMAGEEVEIHISPVSTCTIRLSILPFRGGRLAAIPLNGTLIQKSWSPPVAKLAGTVAAETIRCGDLLTRGSVEPLAFLSKAAKGERIQQLAIDQQTPNVSFDTGNSPLLVLGEGGRQFARRGGIDPMISGQGGYKLATHGGRVPIPWIIGTAGWAIFIHQPFGTFDLTGKRTKFQPAAGSPFAPDLFFVGPCQPHVVMSASARPTG